MTFHGIECHYLSPEWESVRRRSGLSELEILRIWRKRRDAAKKIPMFAGRNRQQDIYRLGLDNPFSSQTAIKILLNKSLRIAKLRAVTEGRRRERARAENLSLNRKSQPARKRER